MYFNFEKDNSETEIKTENNYFTVTMQPHNLKLHQKRGGAVAVTLYNDKLLLIKIQRKDGKTHYELPRGFAKPDETEIKTAERELQEETGQADINSAEIIGHVMPDSGLLDSNIALVLLQTSKPTHLKLESDEKIKSAEWIPLDQVLNLIAEDKITDSYTLSALMLLIAKTDEDNTDNTDDNLAKADLNSDKESTVSGNIKQKKLSDNTSVIKDTELH